MDTNKIREKVAAVRRADDEWDAIPGGYDESEAILKYSTAVNELLAELDAAPKVLTEDSGDMAASLGISEGLQARIDFANRLLEARSSQSRQPSEVLAEPVAWIVVSSIRDIGIPTLAITKEAARQVAIERCYYLSDVQHSEPIPLYLAPAAGLTVEEAYNIWRSFHFRRQNDGEQYMDYLEAKNAAYRARLTAAIQAKS